MTERARMKSYVDGVLTLEPVEANDPMWSANGIESAFVAMPTSATLVKAMAEKMKAKTLKFEQGPWLSANNLEELQSLLESAGAGEVGISEETLQAFEKYLPEDESRFPGPRTLDPEWREEVRARMQRTGFAERLPLP